MPLSQRSISEYQDCPYGCRKLNKGCSNYRGSSPLHSPVMVIGFNSYGPKLIPIVRRFYLYFGRLRCVNYSQQVWMCALLCFDMLRKLYNVRTIFSSSFPYSWSFISYNMHKSFNQIDSMRVQQVNTICNRLIALAAK